MYIFFIWSQSQFASIDEQAFNQEQWNDQASIIHGFKDDPSEKEVRASFRVKSGAKMLPTYSHEVDAEKESIALMVYASHDTNVEE
jgi:hypothetical protein